MFFGCVIISDLYLFQGTVLLNLCFILSENLILSFIDNVTFFVWNVAPVFCLASLFGTGGLAFGLPAILGV